MPGMLSFAISPVLSSLRVSPFESTRTVLCAGRFLRLIQFAVEVTNRGCKRIDSND